MKIMRATHLGWCFGVRDAVALVTAEARTAPVTVLGRLVHNEAVNDRLRRAGVVLRDRLADVATDTVIITAHGTSDKVRAAAAQAVPRVIEATCPLVHAAHRAVRELVAAGYHPVIIGQREHVEVRGLTGDLTAFDVVLTAADVRRLATRPRFGVAAQTTQPIDRVRQLVDVLREQFPESEVRFIDTVCQPTKQRQAAVIELARQCDTVVVIGGRHSNNTHELARTCARYRARVIRVESARELCPSMFTGVDTVGITAGTSTPDEIINEVEAWLRDLAKEHRDPVQESTTHADSTAAAA